MSYPGNASLAQDVQNRILTAFRQSVDSAMRGNRDEALLGCDFVLRLDGQFAPARELQQMLDQNRPPEAYGALLASVGAAPSVPFHSAAPGLVSTFQRLLDARRFEDVLIAAQSQAAAVAGDAKLAQMIAMAQARFEAEPFVKELIDSARRALGAGNMAEVASLVDKARALDASHPGIAELERLQQAAPTSATSLAIDWDEEPSMQVPPPAFDFGAPPELERAPSAPDSPGETSFAALGRAGSGIQMPDVDFSIGSLPDFGTAPAPSEAPAYDDGGGDHGPRVQALLDEGQAAFDQGEYQNAIDSWSRIFLIDIDNQEAARRIEGARQLKAEREREVEELFHVGVGRFDAGDWPAAREAFRSVLQAQPSYVLAREYLDKIDEREAGGDGPRLDLPELAPLASAAPAAAAPGRGGSRGEEILVPPDPSDGRREAVKPAVGGFAAKARRGPQLSPAFLAIGGAVLVALVAGGWFLSTQWSKLFPNAKETAAPAMDSVKVVEAAKKLQAEGKGAAAITQLKRIPPTDGAFSEAQSLIAQWEKLEAERPAALPVEKQAEYARILERANAAFAEGENLLARRHFTAASALSPLDGESAARAQRVEENLKPLTAELQLVKDGEYEMALNRLWRRREAEPGNRDVSRLMVDTYYNLALLDLNRADVKAAHAKTKDGLALDRNDAELDRLEKFCTAYEKKKPDLLYRIFVKYLQPR